MANELEILNDIKEWVLKGEKVAGYFRSINFDYKRLRDAMREMEDRRQNALNELNSIKSQIDSAKVEAADIISAAENKAKFMEEGIAKRMVSVQQLEVSAKHDSEEANKLKRKYEKLVKELQPA